MKWKIELRDGTKMGLDVKWATEAISRVRQAQLQSVVDKAVPDKKVRNRQIKDWESIETEEEWNELPARYISTAPHHKLFFILDNPEVR